MYLSLYTVRVKRLWTGLAFTSQISSFNHGMVSTIPAVLTLTAGIKIWSGLSMGLDFTNIVVDRSLDWIILHGGEPHLWYTERDWIEMACNGCQYSRYSGDHLLFNLTLFTWLWIPGSTIFLVCAMKTWGVSMLEVSVLTKKGIQYNTCSSPVAHTTLYAAAIWQA